MEAKITTEDRVSWEPMSSNMVGAKTISRTRALNILGRISISSALAV